MNPVPTGGNITISVNYAKSIPSGSWLYNGTIIVFWYPGNISVDPDFENRVTFNNVTYHLNLGSVTLNDSGQYVLQGIVPNIKASVNMTVLGKFHQVHKEVMLIHIGNVDKL